MQEGQLVRPFSCGSLALSLTLSVAAAAEPITIEVAYAAFAVDKRVGWPIINFTMKEASKQLFADFTGRHVGRQATFRIDGRIVMTAWIREAILGGAGQISDRSLTIEQAKEMARVCQPARRKSKSTWYRTEALLASSNRAAVRRGRQRSGAG